MGNRIRLFLLVGMVAFFYWLVQVEINKSPRSSTLSRQTERVSPSGGQTDQVDRVDHTQSSSISVPGSKGSKAEPNQGFLPNLPTVSEMREDIKKNPHHISDRVTKFSLELSPNMSRAFEDIDFAHGMFESLENCADDPAGSTPSVIRGICQMNLRRLSEKFPAQFKKRYHRFSMNQDDSVTRLMHVVDGER